EHHWPGNVRELIAAVAAQLVGDDLPSLEASGEEPVTEGPEDWTQAVLSRELPFARARQEAAVAFERRYIAYLLARHGGNGTKAAEASGMTRRHYHRLKSKMP